MALIRQKSKFLAKKQGNTPIRRLSSLQWQYVIETTTQMADKDPSEHERSLFILQLLYGLYLRISELAATDRWMPQMNHFYQDHENRWWFKTVGKGNKERDIAVSNDILKTLKRYRRFLGVTALPSPNESLPLINKTRGKGAIASTRQIRYIVQQCFDTAVARLRKDGEDEPAQTLQSATVHWLGHTGSSDDVKIRPREHLRDDAGHGSGAITDKYIDIELKERHKSAKKKPIVGGFGV